jgi:hypothetical protein
MQRKTTFYFKIVFRYIQGLGISKTITTEAYIDGTSSHIVGMYIRLRFSVRCRLVYQRY